MMRCLKSNWKRFIGASILFLSVVGSGNVFADGGAGTGGSGDVSGSGNLCCGNYWSSANCPMPGYSDCGVPDKGGVSWHIYKTGKKSNKDGLYTDVTSPILLDQFRDGYDKKLASTCSKKKFKYYYALVIDGWNRAANSSKPPFKPYGPMSEKYANGYQGFQYNSHPKYNSSSAVESAVDAGNISGGERVSHKAARQAFKNYCTQNEGAAFCSGYNGSDIPTQVGYFCYAPENVELILKAYDVTTGSEISGHTKKDKVKIGTKASVTADDPIGDYTYLGIYEGKTKSSKKLVSAPNKTYTINKLKEEQIIVYALYESKPIDDLCPVAPTPSSYTNSTEHSGTTSTISKVFNYTAGSGWQDAVWAKPTDDISWFHCYFPGTQRTANTIATKVHATHVTTGTQFEYPNTNDQFMKRGLLKNSYAISSENFSYSDNKSFTIGDDSVRTNQNWSKVTIDNPGKILKEKASSSPQNAWVGYETQHRWGCHWVNSDCDSCGSHDGKCTKHEQVQTGVDANGNPIYKDGACIEHEQICNSCYKDTCTHGSVLFIDSGTSGTANSEAIVKVPYNFENLIEIDEIDKKEEFFYAGESHDIFSTIDTVERMNNIIGESYATKVDNAKLKLEMCYNETDCSETQIQSLPVLNSSGDMNGDTLESVKTNFVIRDMPAGTDLCLRTAVYPKDSHDDANLSPSAYNVNDNDSWAWSEPVCVKVAKKPSIQIMGGNVYTTGSIKTLLSIKQDLHGSDNSKKPYVFGSWGELGVISAGRVIGFASGASLGYKSNDNGILWPDMHANADGEGLGGNYPGGRHGEADFCKMSPLTIANGCISSKDTVSGIGDSKAVEDVKDDRSILEGLVEAEGSYRSIGSGEISINGFDDDGTVRYKKSGNLIVNASTLVKDTFKVIYASGEVTINGDIKVDSNATMENFEQAPKMVIYGKTGIKISCEVGRVDAILVTDGTVDTCYPGVDTKDLPEDKDDDPYNDSKNWKAYSKQLQVNGAIIAKELKATRTYGTARGINSMVSAEVINFDPTLYLWGGSAHEKKAGEGGNDNPLSGDMVTTYIHELAPRL